MLPDCASSFFSYDYFDYLTFHIMSFAILKSTHVESPGPLTRTALTEVGEVWDARAGHFFANYAKSSSF